MVGCSSCVSKNSISTGKPLKPTADVSQTRNNIGYSCNCWLKLVILLYLFVRGDLSCHVMSCCRAVVDDVGDHALPEPSVLWSPDELCWAYFVLQWITQAVQVLQSLTSPCSPPVYPSRQHQILQTLSSQYMSQESKLPLTYTFQ